MIALMLPVMLAGCRRTANDAGSRTATADQQHPGRTRIAVGRAPLWVEIADDPDTRTRGLMFRRSMPEDEGMLFVFEVAEPQSFWMRNTYLPLDIAFIAPDYKIINIMAMKPQDEGPRYNSAGAALYVLEVNQGWFARHGIKPGDLLSFR